MPQTRFVLGKALELDEAYRGHYKVDKENCKPDEVHELYSNSCIT